MSAPRGNPSHRDPVLVARPDAYAWNDRHPYNVRPGTLTVTTEQSDAEFLLRREGRLVGNTFPAHRLAEDHPTEGRDILCLTTAGPARIPPHGIVTPEPASAPWVRAALRRACRATGRRMTLATLAEGGAR